MTSGSDITSQLAKLLGGLGIKVKQGQSSDALRDITLPTVPSLQNLSSLMTGESLSSVSLEPSSPPEGFCELVRRVGFLCKLGQEKSWETGKHGRRWTQRYFVLSERSITWYASSSTDSHSKALGSMPLISLCPSTTGLPIIVNDSAVEALTTLHLSKDAAQGAQSKTALENYLFSEEFIPVLMHELRIRGVTFPTVGLRAKREVGEGGEDFISICSAVETMITQGCKNLPDELTGFFKGDFVGSLEGGGLPVSLITTPDRSLVIAAESSQEINLWVKAITDLVVNEKSRILAMVRTDSCNIITAALSHPRMQRQFSLPESTVNDREQSAPLNPDSKQQPRSGRNFDLINGFTVADAQTATLPVGDDISCPSPTNSFPPRSPASAKTTSLPNTSSFAPPSLQVSIPSPTLNPNSACLSFTTESLWDIAFDEVEVVSRIGSGSCGEVYKGVYVGTPVAIKLLANGGLGSQEDLDALRREVSILSTLRHPNVVLFLGAGFKPPAVFFVMEYCELGSLADLVYDRLTPLSTAVRISAALQTAQGMSYLHAPRHRIIHRDLKCANLLVKRDMSVQVADFGLTVVRARGDEQSSGGQTGLTGGGNRGTPQWMAPELLEGARYTESIDVYAFGIVLCELVGRILPFSDRYSRYDFIDAVLEEGAMPSIPRWCGAFQRDPPQIPPEGASEYFYQQHWNYEALGVIRPSGIPYVWREDAEHFLRENVVRGRGERKVWARRIDEPSSWQQCFSSSKADSAKGKSSPILGGVEEWNVPQGYASGALKLLIEACLSRDPEARPKFSRLTEALRSLTELPVQDFFLQLELPRLREALAYGDSIDASVAACEIMHMTGVLSLSGVCTRTHNSTVVTPLSASICSVEKKKSRDAFTIPRLLFPPPPMPSGFFSPSPFLPFTPVENSLCFTSEAQRAVPTIPPDTFSVVAPELLFALAARLRHNDGVIRSELFMPLTLPDLSSAYASSPFSPGYVVSLRGATREDEDGCGTSVFRASGVFLITYAPKDECFCAIFSPPAPSQHGDAPLAIPASGNANATPSNSTHQRHLRKAVVASIAAVKERQASLLACTQLCLATFLKLLRTMDDTLGGGWRGEDDKGLEPSLAALVDLATPPHGSSNAFLFQCASRIAYSASTLLCCGILTEEEAGVVRRPFGGRGHQHLQRYRTKTTTPSLPGLPVSPGAVWEAGGVLRELWDRFPLLRTALGHCITVTLLSWVARVGSVCVEVSVCGEKFSSSNEGPLPPFTVELGEETVAARYIGICLARLNGESGIEGGTAAMHPLVRSVEGRVRGAEMRREDGVVLWCVDVEHVEAT